MTKSEVEYPAYSEAILDAWIRIAPSYVSGGSYPPQSWQLFHMGCTVEQFEAALIEAFADKTIRRRACLNLALVIIASRLGGNR